MSESIAFTAAFSFGIVLVVTGLVLLDLRFGWSRSKAGSQRLKLMVNCVQQMTVMILFPVDWPDAVKEMGALFASFSLDVSIVSPACLGVPMNYYSRFGISAGLVFAGIIMPWIVAALVSLITACHGGRAGGGQRKRRQGGTSTAAAGGRDGGGGADPMEDIAVEGDGEGGGGSRSTSGEPTLFAETFRATWRRVQPTAARYSLMIVLFAHPALSGQTFFFFSCRAIDGDEYLVADYSLRCGMKDAEWRRLLPFALFMVVCFVIGIPLLLLVLLVKHRAVIKKIGRAFDESRVEAAVLKELGENVDIDKARALYRKVDIDHNGSINFAQFTKFQLIQNEAEAETSSEMVNIVRNISRGSDPRVMKSLADKALRLMNSRVRHRRSIQRRSTASVIGNALRVSQDAAQEDGEDADVSLEMVLADGVDGVEGKGNAENQEVDASTETKGAAEDEETRPRTSTRRARLVAAHILHQDASHAMAGDVQGAILAKERAAAEKDGVEMMLGVLWMNYKPEYFFFDM